MNRQFIVSVIVLLVLTMALFGLNLVALNYLIGGWSGAPLDLTVSNPGAVTWLLPNVRFPAWITGAHNTVACRVPIMSSIRKATR